MQNLAETPIPRDIPLPLPAPEWLLITLLVISFIAHILFVNLMVGGSLLTTIFQILGLKNERYDRLARQIAITITVNKSMAVVLGVAPLLLINALYTIYFYTANALTGFAWILLIPLISVTFLITYLHKYSWDKMQDHKGLHILMTMTASLMFLLIPLVFLVNVNLMLFPEKWMHVRGFLSALALPNVLPRYFHFLGASLAATGLFLVGYFKRDKFDFNEHLEGFNKASVLKLFYSVTLGATAIQYIVGPVVYLSMPSHGLSMPMTLVILTGVIISLPASFWLWQEISNPQSIVGKRFVPIVAALTLTVIFMASGRHLYRSTALAGHQKKMSLKTEQYMAQVQTAQQEAQDLTATNQGTDSAGISGEKVFATYCAACHASETRLVGPPLTEIRSIYGGNPEGIVKWAKAPGKKRQDYPPMPPINIPEQELLEAAKYILK